MLDDIRRGLDEVVVHFAELEDPRSEINLRHPLVSVVVIALMAVLAGANGPTAIVCITTPDFFKARRFLEIIF